MKVGMMMVFTSYGWETCPGVDPGTAVVIVPWHDPLRVAEAAVLDMLNKGRFRLSMDEPCERFDATANRLVGIER